MVDNVAITAGSGTTIGADDVGGVLIQRVKNTWGPDGTANDTDVATGKPLPVQLRGSDGTDRSNELPVSIASGKVASGAIASGAVASGAFASGSIASGAVASGAIAAGAIAAGATSIADNEDAASADGDRGVKILARRTAAPANTSGTDLDYEMLQMANGQLWTSAMGFQVTVLTSVTRPSDTTAYAANDAISNSTSAPTSGGFTFSNCARKSGGSGIITDAMFIASTVDSTALQGILYIFDTSVTNVNDNAAFTITDGEALTLVAKIPFTIVSEGSLNGSAHVQNLAIGFTTVGSADLRFLYKATNAWTPGNAEVLTCRLKILQTD